MTYCIPTQIPNKLPVIQYTTGSSIEGMLDKCLKYYGVSYKGMIYKSRKRDILWRRQMVTYVLSKHGNHILDDVARVMGYRDHSMTIYCITVVKERIKADVYIKQEYELLIKHLGL